MSLFNEEAKVYQDNRQRKDKWKKQGNSIVKITVKEYLMKSGCIWDGISNLTVIS